MEKLLSKEIILTKLIKHFGTQPVPASGSAVMLPDGNWLDLHGADHTAAISFLEERGFKDSGCKLCGGKSVMARLGLVKANSAPGRCYIALPDMVCEKQIAALEKFLRLCVNALNTDVQITDKNGVSQIYSLADIAHIMDSFRQSA